MDRFIKMPAEVLRITSKEYSQSVAGPTASIGKKIEEAGLDDFDGLDDFEADPELSDVDSPVNFADRLRYRVDLQWREEQDIDKLTVCLIV